MNREGVTAVSALHAFMTKMHGAPVYQFLHKFGRSHKPWFRYRCEAMADEVFGTGRSKKDAKQVVARLMLEQLSLRGYKVPPEFVSPDAIRIHMEHKGWPTQNFVALVKELCTGNGWGVVQYEVVVDPAGQFTAKARISHVERVATDSSKLIAQNIAAEKIYKYLHTRLTDPQAFIEDQAMYRTSYQRAMASTSNGEIPDEQRRADEEPGTSTSVSRRPPRRNRRKRNRRRAAVQSAVPLNQPELDQSEQGGYEVGPEGPPSPDTLFVANNNIAMNLLSRTMDSLGI